ncbi:hypothetical protein [Methylobacterium sp. J-067]|jgi:hypothetical protein|uniref:hypothetical protein n=1 Tax=Methylobacterium sp. J-067 TaxID=2836648 RepID=UPI001FBB5F66|nr:hypothetical protein [Methylobacterium sp. J-067]MCJ2024767.1 hypothetical protein [Methylobacterium sp. J-067]
MTDWSAIVATELVAKDRQHIEAFLRESSRDSTSDGHCAMYQAGGSLPDVDPDGPVAAADIALFLEILAGMRPGMNRRREWDYLLDLIIPDAPEAVIAIIERETGLTDDQSFPPHLDPERPQGRAVWEAEEAAHRAWKVQEDEKHRLRVEAAAEYAARRAAEKEARLARRRRIPVPVADPTRQLALVFPDAPTDPTPTKLTRLPSDTQFKVTQLMRAWLGDQVTPIKSFLATGTRGRDLWAHVRLVEGKRGLIIFENGTGRNGTPLVRYRGGDLVYYTDLETWGYSDYDSAADENTRPAGWVPADDAGVPEE